MTEERPESATADEAGEADGRAEERRLQRKLDSDEITEAEYARLTALRFGEDPDRFSFADAAAFFDLSEAELRAEIAWLAGRD